jgi:hypothetical protein
MVEPENAVKRVDGPPPRLTTLTSPRATISGLDHDTDAVRVNIERLTKLALQVQVTELDVSLPVRFARRGSKRA